jgi:hypothetical protein
LFPLPPECALAVEFKDVDNSSVIAGGVTTANFPQAAKNFRRSAEEAASASFIGLGNCGLDMELSLFAAGTASQISQGKQFRVLIGSACLPRQKQIKPISLFSSRLSVMLPTGHTIDHLKRKTRQHETGGLDCVGQIRRLAACTSTRGLPHGVRCPHLSSSGCT